MGEGPVVDIIQRKEKWTWFHPFPDIPKIDSGRLVVAIIQRKRRRLLGFKIFLWQLFTDIPKIDSQSSFLSYVCGRFIAFTNSYHKFHFIAVPTFISEFISQMIFHCNTYFHRFHITDFIQWDTSITDFISFDPQTSFQFPFYVYGRFHISSLHFLFLPQISFECIS